MATESEINNQLLKTLKSIEKQKSQPSSQNLPESHFMSGLDKKFSNLGTSTDGLLKSFNDLSNYGANFSNDIAELGISARQSGLSLEDFSDIIIKNGKYMSNLGGSVSKGTENFAKLSKGLFEGSDLGVQMKNLGYTTREINDLLATQVGMQGSININDAEQRNKLYQSTAALSKEMDAIAKLTGKSRQEQMEQMKLNQMDSKLNAKFKLIEREQDKEAADAARKNFDRIFAKADAEGYGQAFKEAFLTGGSLMTQTAMDQAAIGGQAATEVMKSAQALSKGQIDSANAAIESSEKFNAALQNNTAYLQNLTISPMLGSLGDSFQKHGDANLALSRSVDSTAESLGQLTESQRNYKEILDKISKDIEISQAGARATKEGGVEKTGQITEAAVAFQTGMENIQRGIATAMENEALPLMREGAQIFHDSAIQLRDQLTDGKNIAEVLPEGANQMVNIFKDGVNSIKDTFGVDLAAIVKSLVPNSNIPGYSDGTLGVHGKLFNDFGPGTMVEVHGPEAIVTPDTMGSIISVAANTGVNKLIGQLNDGFNPDKNISSVSKEINSTINITGGGTTTSQLSQSKDSLNAETELGNVTKQFENDMQQVRDRIKSELGDNATFLNVQSAIKTDPIAKQLKSDYEQAEKVLSQRINAGKSFETFKQDFDANSNQALQQLNDFRKESINSIVNVNDEYGSHLDTLYDYKNEEINFDKKFAEQRKEIESTLSSELLSKANSAKNIVGKSVEGMSEEAIKSLLPAGSTMEEFYVDINGKLQNYNNDYVNSISSTLENGGKIIETSLNTTSSQYKTFNDNITSLVPNIPQDQINKVQNDITSLITNIKPFDTKIDVSNINDNIQNQLKNLSPDIKFDSLQNDISKSSDIIQNGIKQYNTQFDTGIASTGNLVTSILGSFTGINSAYSNHINDMIGFKNESFDVDKQYAEKSISLSKMNNENIFGINQKSMSNIGKSIENIGNDAFNLLGTAGTQLGKVMNTVSTDVSDFFGDAVNNVSDFFSSGNENMTSALDTANVTYKTFNDEISSITPTFATPIDNTKNQDKNDFLNINSDFIKSNTDFLQSSGNFLKNNQNALKDSIPDNFKDLKNDNLDKSLQEHFKLLETTQGKEKSDNARQEFDKNFNQIKEYLGENEANKYKENFSKSSLPEVKIEKTNVPPASSAMETIESTQKQIDDKLEKLFGIENNNKPKPTETKYTEESTNKPKPEIVKKEATLNDVVTSLEMVNKQLSQLLTQHEDIGRKQVKATRDNNGNLFKI